MLKIKLSGIKQMELLAYKDSDVISLSQGSLKIGGIPEQIKKHVQRLLNTDKTDYYANVFGILALRKKIAEVLSKKHKISISSNQILITHGSSGAIANLFLLLLNPGDEVLLPEPTYPAYAKLALIAKAKVKFISCYSNSNAQTIDWDLIIEKIKSATTPKTKIITIANPCNPTGEIIPPNIIFDLVNWCNQNGIYLITDEVYDDFIFNEEELQSATQYINESSFVIRCGSFSKNFSMSGWRIGYAVLSQKILSQTAAVQDTLLVCPSVIGQYAALYALDHPEFTQIFKEKIHCNLMLANKMLEPLVKKEIISYKSPKAAFYLFLKTKEKDSSNLCLDILQKSKITIVPGKTFGPTGASFIRICYARQKEIFKEGLQRFLNYWENF